MSKKDDTTLDLILQEVRETKRLAEENNKSINGYAGQPGLYSLYNAACNRIDSIEKLLSNDIAHLAAKMDMVLANHVEMDRAVSQATTSKNLKIEQLESSNTVKWSEILKEWVKPVIVAIITAALTYLIVTQNLAVK